MRTRNNGNLTIGTQLIANGGNAPDGTNPGLGKLGGFDGGKEDHEGNGPGAGRREYDGIRGGSAGYGGMGFSDGDVTKGQPYGDALLSDLLGGSSGGGGDRDPGGAGGGAIELIAHGDGVLSLTASAKISVNGGDAYRSNSKGGGAGSGGAIRLQGGSISCLGTLEAKSSPTFALHAGGGGRIAIQTNGNLVLGSIDLSGYRPGTLHISGTTATSSLDFSSGTLTFDTTHGYWHHTSGVHGTGVLEQKDDGGIQYKTSTFAFDSINLASGLTVKLEGDNSLILKTRNHGNITIGTNLNANGGDSEVTPSGYSDSLSFGLGKLGGKNGGLKNSGAHGNGLGTGGGKLRAGGVTNNFVGGGGGYGTAGQYYSNDTNFGKTYGSTALTHLHGGSGGGGATSTGGGAGGGAISLEADGNGTLTIQSGATISANGGGIASTLVQCRWRWIRWLYQTGRKINYQQRIDSGKGGTPPSTSSTYDGGIGGGGRVAFNYSTNLVEGTVDVGSGAYIGTKGYNTPPTISSALTASITYSNDKYRKRSTVRYDDLVFWYPFDEASGSIAEDYSTHERNATLINMSGANRIAGKSGGALSFTTTPLDLSTQLTSGQYLDLGDWSFGGDFTFSAWVRVDYTNINSMILMGLSNGSTIDDLMLRQTNTGQALLRLLDTAGGTEEYISNPFYTAGQWIHLLVTMNNGGANASTVKFYKDGSLFQTSAADLSPPLVKTRTEQFIGRSTSNLKYFQGDLDDLRLYDIVLTDSEISSLYAETTTGIHYQTQALNNPTGFSAIGLPSGLSINPTTGAITGQTMSVGDHNITLTASNLSGTSPSKNLILTVAPDKPLFETEPFDPGDLADLKLWLDAADTSTITHSSNAVSQWNDKSGNNFHHTNFGSPTTNTQQVNGKNVIAFDGNDVLKITNTSLGDLINGTNNDMAVFAVFLNSQDNSMAFRLSQTSGNNSSFQLGSQYNENQMRTIFYNSAGQVDGVDGNIELINQTFILQGGYDGSLVKQFVNGTEFTGGLGNDGIGTITGASVSKIGEGLNGHIAEIIALDNWTPSATRQKIEGYLAHKWGLSGYLPSNHPYKISSKQSKISISSIGTNSATVLANLLDLGGASTALSAHYGTFDGGTDIISWQGESNHSGVVSPGQSTIGLNNLAASTSYFVRVKATNSAGSTWSDAFSFTTGSVPNPPALTVSNPTVVGNTTATTKGHLLSFDGSTNPTITLYYGTSDGNQTPANWNGTSSPISLSTKPIGSLDHNLTGLSTGTTYYYRYFATTTIGGTAYSTYSDLGTFTTLAPPNVQTLAVSPIDKTKATLNAKPSLSGNDTASITFYWGDNNGSNSGNHNQWDHNLTVSGTHNSGTVISYPITGLTTGTNYYAVAKVTNSLNTSAYGSVVSFKAADRTFTKHSVPGLVLWLDANDVDGNGNPDSLGDGSSISAWVDKSTKGVTVNQTNSGSQPVYKSTSFGSKPAVRFDGIDDVLNLTPIRSTAGGYSVYVATRRHDTLGDTNAHIIDEAGWNLIADATNQPYAPKILAKSAASHATLTNLKIGKDAGGTNNDFGGDIGEILIFDRKLSSTEEAKILDHLAYKWGVPATTIFSPSRLPSLKLWLDAADTSTVFNSSTLSTLATSNVGGWMDKSGNANHATQITSGDQPTITTGGMSGKAGLDFNNDKLSIPEIDMAGKTLLAVIQPDTTQEQQILSHSSVNVQLRLETSNKLQYASASPLYTNGTASTGSIVNNQISIVCFTLDNTLAFSINGTYQDSGVSKGSSGSSIFNQIGTRGTL